MDKLDHELSRTYFKKPQGTKKGQGPKSLRLFPAISLFIFVLLIFSAAYFLYYKQITLSVNINVNPGSARPALAMEKTTSGQKGRTLYDFETTDEGWEIPSWTLDKTDHVARKVELSADTAASGMGSLKITAEFHGRSWTAALIEIQQYLDLESYNTISCDIYLPPGAPEGLKGKIILTIGDSWRFVEMARSAKLIPGAWNKISASISDESLDWKRAKPDGAFRQDVRKIAIRIESNNIPYAGAVYADNVRVD